MTVVKRDNRYLWDLLNATMKRHPSRKTIRSWTDSQAEAVEDWATDRYLNAHRYGVQPAPRPEFL
jgi:hypothetical protein